MKNNGLLRMTLAIFLNNKLISCDTILPVAMEVHVRTGKPVLFFTTDSWTFEAIRENVVLWDAIHRIGRLVLLGKKSGSWLSRRFAKLKAVAMLSSLAVKARLGRARILHFRALHTRPFDLLARIAPDAVFFCESDSYGETELMQRMAAMVAARRRDSAPPRGGSLVAFQPKWVWLSDPTVRGLPHYVFGPTRTRKVWIDYVKAVADKFHQQVFAASGEADQHETIVFLLGYMGKLDYLNGEQATQRLFSETLDILCKEGGGRPILLKPHVITDMAVVTPKIEEARKKGARILVANLHPSVLATRACAFVANYYSTTLADGYLFGVPIIEYTDYSQAALDITSGGSMRSEYVTHFINNDRDKLRAALKEVITMPRRSLPQGIVGDPSGLIDRLAGTRAAADYTLVTQQDVSWPN